MDDKSAGTRPVVATPDGTMYNEVDETPRKKNKTDGRRTGETIDEFMDRMRGVDNEALAGALTKRIDRNSVEVVTEAEMDEAEEFEFLDAVDKLEKQAIAKKKSRVERAERLALAASIRGTNLDQDFMDGAELAVVKLFVNDYDEAIHWFVSRLAFLVVQDQVLQNGRRFVVIKPRGVQSAGFLLYVKTERSGTAGAGTVAYVLQTPNFERDYAIMVRRCVYFKSLPIAQPYGKVAVFADLYGNLWDLRQNY